MSTRLIKLNSQLMNQVFQYFCTSAIGQQMLDSEIYRDMEHCETESAYYSLPCAAPATIISKIFL